MDDNLLGYLLNSLDEAEHRQVEEYLQANPPARERLEALRQALAPLAEDRDSIVAPPNLAVRCLAYVAEHCCRELPRSPLPTSRAVPSRPFWRRADVLVAASLLLAVLAFSFPLVAKLRHDRAKIECQNNLREFYTALQSYYNVRGNLPNYTDKTPLKVPGMIAPLLHDAGLLEKASMRCPANGSPLPCTVSLAQLQQLCSPGDGGCGSRMQQQADGLIPCYAYSLGYNEAGNYHFPNVPTDLPAQLLPLMADRPPLQAQQGNSLNHGGLGQNVLFHDGHVLFAVSRNVGIDGDDIYLNRDMKVGAGLDCRDTVLGSSGAKP